MRPFFDEVGRHGWDVFLSPERFREILVILFTGVGEHPGEVLQMLFAWVLAVLVADRIYPKR